MELEGVIMRHKGPFFSLTSFLTPTASQPLSPRLSLPLSPLFLLSVYVSLPSLVSLCLRCHLLSQNFETPLLEHESFA